MRVFKKNNITYVDLLEGMKLLIAENGEKNIFVSKEQLDIVFDYMLELENKAIQKFLIKGILSIDQRITEAYENQSLYDAFHKLPLIVSLIKIVKEGGYPGIRDFNAIQSSTLAMVTCLALKYEFYPRVVAVFAQKQILDKILEKSQSINDNLLLALEAEKRTRINYNGNLKMQIIKLCKYLDFIDEKDLQEIFSKGIYRKK